LCAGASPSSCALLLARLLLSCRLPDHLLRLLKWLIESETELRAQREARTADNSTAASTCVKQIDRILAHWSARHGHARAAQVCLRHGLALIVLPSLHVNRLCVCSSLSGVMEEMAWKTLWRIEQLIKSGSYSRALTGIAQARWTPKCTTSVLITRLIFIMLLQAH